MAKNANTLFSYQDKDGVDVVVDRIEDVPQQYRSKMKVMTLDGIAHDVTPKAVAAVPETKQLPAVDMGSAAIGAAGGLFVGVLAGLIMGKLGGRSRLVGMFMTLALMAGVMTMYFTFARQQMGLTGSSPTAVVQDTQAAKQLIEGSHDQKMKVLEAIEKSEK